MDKKFLLKTILLNTAWIIWIGLSVFLGYIIYIKAFPNQPVVIIPFSLLFLVVGGVAVYFANKFLKKRRAVKTESSGGVQSVAERAEGSAAAADEKCGRPIEGEGDNILRSTVKGEEDDITEE